MTGPRQAGPVRPGAPEPEPGVHPGEIERIVAGLHHDPHALLGAHPGPDGVTVGPSCRWPPRSPWYSPTAAASP